MEKSEFIVIFGDIKIDRTAFVCKLIKESQIKNIFVLANEEYDMYLPLLQDETHLIRDNFLGFLDLLQLKQVSNIRNQKPNDRRTPDTLVIIDCMDYMWKLMNDRIFIHSYLYNVRHHKIKFIFVLNNEGRSIFDIQEKYQLSLQLATDFYVNEKEAVKRFIDQSLLYADYVYLFHLPKEINPKKLQDFLHESDFQILMNLLQEKSSLDVVMMKIQSDECKFLIIKN